LSWIIWALVFVVALYVVMGIYLATVLKWEDEQTIGLNYYGRSLRDRERFKRSLARHASLLSPMLWINARMAKVDFTRVRIQYKGVSAPAGSCSVESFQRAERYQPTAQDIFVVTQMKCGTTWMQNVVYEILNRGKGNLVETGTAMYAISPWLEGRKSVSFDKAPTIGAERPSRIIKTHLPVVLCPTIRRRASSMWHATRRPASRAASTSCRPTWAAWRRPCRPSRSGSVRRT
jgi:hypothetical protein